MFSDDFLNDYSVTRINELTKKAGYSKTQVADILGISYKDYDNMLDNIAGPNAALIKELCKLFNVSFVYLLGINKAGDPKVDAVSRMKYLRMSNGYTQGEIADFLGISQSEYSKFENNKADIGVDYLLALSKYYRVSMDYITGASEETARASDEKAIKDLKRLQNVKRQSQDLCSVINDSKRGINDIAGQVKELKQALKEIAMILEDITEDNSSNNNTT